MAILCKELKENLETAMYQSCSELGVQDPSVGTLVPSDSEIYAVAVQNLTEWIIFSHSVPTSTCLEIASSWSLKSGKISQWWWFM